MSEDIHEIQARHSEENGKKDYGADDIRVLEGLEAVRLRLRPILMTSLAFMFGVLPLAFSSGAGSASRRAIGTGVLGGMGSATVLGLIFVPLFFVLICQFFQRRRRQPGANTLPAAHAEGGA